MRDATLEGSAALLANLPLVEALMTTEDRATIQDGSVGLWKRVGGDLFVFADRQGRLKALHTRTPEFTALDADGSLQRSLQYGDPHGWWYGGGTFVSGGHATHIFRGSLQPHRIGSPGTGVGDQFPNGGRRPSSSFQPGGVLERQRPNCQHAPSTPDGTA
jgi:hypothetical protein